MRVDAMLFHRTRWTQFQCFTIGSLDINVIYFRGIYYHLTQTWCGVGNRDPAESRRKVDADLKSQ